MTGLFIDKTLTPALSQQAFSIRLFCLRLIGWPSSFTTSRSFGFGGHCNFHFLSSKSHSANRSITCRSDLVTVVSFSFRKWCRQAKAKRVNLTPSGTAQQRTMLENGADIRVIQKLLGHASITGAIRKVKTVARKHASAAYHSLNCVQRCVEDPAIVTIARLILQWNTV